MTFRDPKMRSQRKSLQKLTLRVHPGAALVMVDAIALRSRRRPGRTDGLARVAAGNLTAG